MPRTIKNLWFISYRINQVPSQHIFYHDRPPGASNIPPKDRLHQGQILDGRAAKLREAEQWKKEANELRAPRLSDSQGLFLIEKTHTLRTYSHLDQKLEEVDEKLKKWRERWGQVTLSKDHSEPRNYKPQKETKTFKQVLEEHVKNYPQALKALWIATHGAAEVLQKRASNQYFHKMSTNLYWSGKKNNATTKSVRAYFGLPVEPLTAINTENAGIGKDDPRMDVERSIPDFQRILAARRPLKWLDEYTESLNGEHGLRSRPKPEDLAYKNVPDHIEELLF